MTNFWALIAASRPHCFSLGKHEDEEKAYAFATAYCVQKNEKLEEGDPDYVILALLDESDLRMLTGEVHRPWKIAGASKREVAVEAPTRQGIDGPVEAETPPAVGTGEDDAAPADD
jgi:hypothetical protein